MRKLVLLLGMVAVLCGAAQHARAEKRIALVIGNSSYKFATRLTNPANDATAMATLLRVAGFSVVEARRDLSITDMRRALREFADNTRDADIAVVFYAGHGIEVDGTNYLLPVDAALERDLDVEDEGIALDRILRILEPVKRLRLVILDACRDNPLTRTMKRTVASRSVGRGLAKIEPTTSNTLIAFAAKAGSTAADGDGANSPFTTALLKNLATPGLDLRIAFGRVRDDVLTATANKQEPYVYGSLGGRTVSLIPKIEQPVVVAPPPPPVDATANARRDYELAAQVGTKEAWDYFLAAHSTGLYANLARAQRDKIVREEARLAAAAKAAEAKAIADAKAAEQKAAAAKAAAEAKAIADAKAAEQKTAAAKAVEMKAAADAKAAEEKAARATAEAKSKTEDKPIVLAAVPPEAPQPAAPASRSISDITRSLQSELRRVGCYTGAINGEWNDPSRSALELFNKHAGMQLDVKLASLDSIDVIKGKSTRICPLQCQRGYRADKDVCVKITCPRGQVLGADGECTARDKRKSVTAPDAKPSDAPAAKPAGGSQIYCNATGCRQLKPGCRAVQQDMRWEAQIVCN
jgi:uncharacterized caspase-like protein